MFPYFKKAQGITLDVFLGKLLPFLDSVPKNVKFAVEVRNKPFLKPAFLQELKKRKTALVLIDHVWMPSPEKYMEMEGIFTASYVPIRFLGDRYAIEKVTKTWEKSVVDKSDRLKRWAEVIKHALASGLDVNAFANNHYEGHAPDTVHQLVEMVKA